MKHIEYYQMMRHEKNTIGHGELILEEEKIVKNMEIKAIKKSHLLIAY